METTPQIYPSIDLRGRTIDPSILNIIPEIVARSHSIIAFGWDDKTLNVATTHPDNSEMIDLLQKKLGYTFHVYTTDLASLEEALQLYRTNLDASVKALLEELKKNPEREENIVKLVNTFLEYAYTNRASDIHIEPQRAHVTVRYRIDGILHEAMLYERNLHDKIIFRLKIMSRLPTDEHDSPQDGRFTYHTGTRSFDVRISIVPVTDGENVVMRLLAEGATDLTIDGLGFNEQNLKKIKAASKKSFGMILSVGPTGSGKTTTLYAILRTLNQPEVNIMTIEDPVEYDMDHIQQIQVNEKADLTFANGLRSIVRQDPNIIMVGEIRDREAASIAVNAAMTGHLLLSTLHANDAATTFPRLSEMNIEPFLIASSINIVIAQRLVRKICDHCKQQHSLSPEEIEALNDEPELLSYITQSAKTTDIASIPFFRGAGCSACNTSGYSGRVCISEVLEVTEDMRPLIVQKATADAITKKAIELGMIPILHDGAMKIVAGITTLEEVIRTTRV